MEIFMDEVQEQQVEPIEQPIEQQVEQPTEQAPVEEKPKEDVIPKGVQRRIDRAVRQKYEAENRAKELEFRLRELEAKMAPAQDESKAPKFEDFNNDFDAYTRAVARYEAKQEFNQTLTAHQKAVAEQQAQAAQQRSADTWAKRAAAAQAEMPDWAEVVGSATDIVLDNAATQAIQESELGPKIAYYLATNHDEADRISELSGMAAVRAIGRIEAKLEGQKVSVTKTPAPITPVGQKAKVSKDPNEMSPKEFAEWRKKHMANRY